MIYIDKRMLPMIIMMNMIMRMMMRGEEEEK